MYDIFNLRDRMYLHLMVTSATSGEVSLRGNDVFKSLVGTKRDAAEFLV